MSKILILGASGFVGKHLCSHLENHEITYLVRKTSDISHLKNGKIIYGDITNQSDLLKASKGVDIIINLTAPNTQQAEINQAIIVDGTRNLIAAAKNNKVKKIINLGSAAAYRKNLDNYGRAKKETEELIVKSGLDIIHLKPSMVYGRGGYAFEKLLASITQIPFFVFVIGDGQYKIQPVYIEEVVQAILKSIEFPVEGVKVLDLGGPYPKKYDEFIEKILKIINKKKIIIHLSMKFVITLVNFLNLFFKNLNFNKTTVKRLTEEITLDIDTTKKTLGITMTDYETALHEVLKNNFISSYLP